MKRTITTLLAVALIGSLCIAGFAGSVSASAVDDDGGDEVNQGAIAIVEQDQDVSQNNVNVQEDAIAVAVGVGSGDVEAEAEQENEQSNANAQIGEAEAENEIEDSFNDDSYNEIPWLLR
ncbi:hypothetical protein [Natrinema caseinilyticum]|uniref:hypothetical protein n=1 Tax=Natrinema caseinilyticum TaxID=2961570 RepID=UPI0020C27907|nr:hypothetical protein [Natrinema caseinilyticum]